MQRSATDFVRLLNRSLSGSTEMRFVVGGDPSAPHLDQRALVDPDAYLPLFAIDAIETYGDSGLGESLGPLGIDLHASANAPLRVVCRFNDHAEQHPAVLLLFLRESVSRQIAFVADLRPAPESPVSLAPLLAQYPELLAQIDLLAPIENPAPES